MRYPFVLLAADDSLRRKGLSMKGLAAAALIALFASTAAYAANHACDA